MPVLKPKQMVWKCKTEGCVYEINEKYLSTRFELAFGHYLAEHGLGDLNHQWFESHIKNYFDII